MAERMLLVVVATEAVVKYLDRKHGDAVRKAGEWFATDLPKPVNIKLDDEQVVIKVNVTPRKK